ncbi:39S ribosomal protein L52, mitochondrial-like [Dendronephthya gigantea]|uniref:39S ribosomal protein L52, mitochondrial-like n=1 Tax=Dendronephthya gigantea TaxID=151771 RepID=UPI00106D3B8D|nr:39S ribosomal protein L52, mitochondrial-like [Dendronephthya gigantea]
MGRLNINQQYGRTKITTQPVNLHAIYFNFLVSLSVVTPTCVKINFISISSAIAGGQKWRIRNGLAGDGLASGPLTDLPDWSYIDGQPSPESKRRKKRQNTRHRESERIMQYLKEVDEKKPSNPGDSIS